MSCKDVVSRKLISIAKGLHRFANNLRLIAARLVFVPRPDDIYIVSYPRSGTTLVQMILHQLTTNGGPLTFTHISETIPFLERALLMMGRDLSVLPSPRVFKTHLPYGMLSRWPGKYIYVIRDGKDVLLSYLHFHNSHLRVRGAGKKTLNDFFPAFLAGKVEGGSWFKHVSGWLNRAHRDNILVVQYERLLSDLPSEVHRIGAFCDIDVDRSTLQKICERCQLNFMKSHQEQFDHMNELLWERQFESSSFIRTGRIGGWKQDLSDQQVLAFEAKARRLLKAWHYPLEGRDACAPGEPSATVRYVS